MAKADGTFSKWLSQLSKIDIIILDDWGLTPLEDEQKRDLLEILDDRYQRSSTIITRQLPTSNWHEYLNQETLADAILDRLLHQAIKLPLPLEGDSLRKRYRKENAEKI